MTSEDMTRAVNEFRAKQQAEMDAFCNGLIESIKAQPVKRKEKSNYRYVYVTAKDDGSYAVRLQHRYGQRYLRSGIDNSDKAAKDAKYLDDALAVFADAIRREQRQPEVQP